MKTATLRDLPLLRRYFEAYPHRLCVYTPGVLMMWREYFRLALREEEETLTVRLAYDGGEDTYLYPVGRDPRAAIDRLRAECRRDGRPLTFFAPEEEELATLRALFPTATEEDDRGEADYLYKTASLATFSGRRYGGQRNHINRFSRLYPDHTVEEIRPHHAEELIAFLDTFRSLHSERPLFLEELSMTREVIEHYGEYRMDGILLRAEGRVAAFACGEVVGDMLAVHIEKADTRVAGSYQKIVSAFASRYAPTAVPLLNREDDMGDEGLRTSKLSYHPIEILPKMRFRIPVEAL